MNPRRCRLPKNGFGSWNSWSRKASAYNICRASRLLGNLNPSALEASLNEIISRHETLRTAFRLVDGRPVQVVQPARNISIEIADLRSMPTKRATPKSSAGSKENQNIRSICLPDRYFDRTLLRAGDQEHVLILMTHHSVSDAWSMGILTRELWTLYEAFSNRKSSPLERSPGSVLGLRGLATQLAPRRSARRAARLLEKATQRSRHPQPANRPTESAASKLSRRARADHAARGADGIS